MRYTLKKNKLKGSFKNVNKKTEHTLNLKFYFTAKMTFYVSRERERTEGQNEQETNPKSVYTTPGEKSQRWSVFMTKDKTEKTIGVGIHKKMSEQNLTIQNYVKKAANCDSKNKQKIKMESKL